MPSHRPPDFFIVGHPKCGTTALYEILLQHAEVFMPHVKEPGFLAADRRRLFQPKMAGPLPATIDEYLDLFTAAEPAQRAGEASTWYLSSHTAATAIAELNPEARIVAIFREPASFLRSLHLQNLQDHLEDKRDFRRALSLEGQRRNGRRIPRRSYRPQALFYTEHVRYCEQLERYRSAFPGDRVLVLTYDEVRRDNEEVARKIFRFLGIEDSVPITMKDTNPTVMIRSQWLDDTLHRVSVGRESSSRSVKAVIKAFVPRTVRRRMLSAMHRHVVFTSPPPVDEELMRELRLASKPEVEKFGSMLGEDLVDLWGYDRL
jgi:hypothetical protein